MIYLLHLRQMHCMFLLEMEWLRHQRHKSLFKKIQCRCLKRNISIYTAREFRKLCMDQLKLNIGIKIHGIYQQNTYHSTIMTIKQLKMTDGVQVNLQHMQETSISTRQSLVSLVMIYFLTVSTGVANILVDKLNFFELYDGIQKA